MDAQVLTVSSKRQISLPDDICKLLSIETGDKLVAYVSGDAIMLKTLKLPSAKEKISVKNINHMFYTNGISNTGD